FDVHDARSILWDKASAIRGLEEANVEDPRDLALLDPMVVEVRHGLAGPEVRVGDEVVDPAWHGRIRGQVDLRDVRARAARGRAGGEGAQQGRLLREPDLRVDRLRGHRALLDGRQDRIGDAGLRDPPRGLPSYEGEAEPQDLREIVVQPGLGGVQDRGVLVADRRHQRADQDLRISPRSDEGARRRGPEEIRRPQVPAFDEPGPDPVEVRTDREAAALDVPLADAARDFSANLDEGL